MLARFRLACQAMLMEFVSLAMNPRMTLFADKSVIDLVRADSNGEAIRQFEEYLAANRWALYRVRRCRVGKNWDRSVTQLAVGGRGHVSCLLNHHAAREGARVETEPSGVRRAWLRRRHGGAGPDGEEFLVGCPHLVAVKQKASFEDNWSQLRPLNMVS